MATTVNQVMTADPRTVTAEDTLLDAAKHMRDGDVGAVVIDRDGTPAGILTDRDIVVRAVADGRDPSSTRVGDIAGTGALITVEETQTASEAARTMRENDIRRVVVVKGGRAGGIVSIGDLAVALDDESALADISSSSPNN